MAETLGILPRLSGPAATELAQNVTIRTPGTSQTPLDNERDYLYNEYKLLGRHQDGHREANRSDQPDQRDRSRLCEPELRNLLELAKIRL
jgi:hypothetical protein